MQDPQTLQNAGIVETREKSYWIQADCIVNGREQKSLRFWVPKSQAMVDGNHITVPAWLLEKSEEGIAEWENKRLKEGKRSGDIYRTVEVLVNEAGPAPEEYPPPGPPNPNPVTEDDLPF